MNKITRLFASKIQQSFCGAVLFYLKLEQEAYEIITQILKISPFRFTIGYLGRLGKEKE